MRIVYRVMSKGVGPWGVGDWIVRKILEVERPIMVLQALDEGYALPVEFTPVLIRDVVSGAVAVIWASRPLRRVARSLLSPPSVPPPTLRRSKAKLGLVG